MRKPIVILAAIIPLLGCVVIGCKARIKETANERFAFDAVERSEIFHEITTNLKRVSCMIDGSDARFFTVAVGESTDERFLRMETLRVEKGTGDVYRQVTDSAGDLHWVRERKVR